MPDIFHHFPINAGIAKVFAGISTPKGLNAWWSKSSSGNPALAQTYQLNFGPNYNWSALVTKCIPNTEFELQFNKSADDWDGTKVGFILTEEKETTLVKFYHTGWKQADEHFKISNFCWAMYLRILKRHLEHNENVPYEERLEV